MSTIQVARHRRDGPILFDADSAAKPGTQPQDKGTEVLILAVVHFDRPAGRSGQGGRIEETLRCVVFGSETPPALGGDGADVRKAHLGLHDPTVPGRALGS